MLSDRIRSVDPSQTVAISDRVKQKKAAGEPVIDLSVGEPDFPTPDQVVKAAEKALHDGKTHYGPSRGIPQLRDAIAQRQTRDRGMPCQTENVLVTPAKHALLTFFLTVAEPGDEVIIPTPAWVSYAPQARISGATPTPVQTDDGRIDPDTIQDAITPDTRAIVLNSPSNPTGSIQPEPVVQALLDIAHDNDLWLLSDEVYGELTYENATATSPAALQDDLENIAIVDGVSKAYAMTGWRIGWLVGPTQLMDQALKIQQHSITHPTLFAQYGAVEALTNATDDLTRMREAFQQRRRFVHDQLTRLDATFPPLEGAFYAFPRFPGHDSGQDLAHHLLEDASVAVTPGEAFGPGGEGHVRLSYAASHDDLQAAFDRIQDTLEA